MTDKISWVVPMHRELARGGTEHQLISGRFADEDGTWVFVRVESHADDREGVTVQMTPAQALRVARNLMLEALPVCGPAEEIFYRDSKEIKERIFKMPGE